jgi:hypothetical protein
VRNILVGILKQGRRRFRRQRWGVEPIRELRLVAEIWFGEPIGKRITFDLGKIWLDPITRRDRFHAHIREASSEKTRGPGRLIRPADELRPTRIPP